MSHGMYSSVLSKISNFLMYSIQEPHDIWYKMILRLHPYDMPIVDIVNTIFPIPKNTHYILNGTFTFKSGILLMIHQSVIHSNTVFMHCVTMVTLCCHGNSCFFANHFISHCR